VPARPLSLEQRAKIRDTVLGLAEHHGFDGWRISDVIERTGISSRTLYKYYPSKEYLLLDAMIVTASHLLDNLVDDAATGKDPRTRVLRTLSKLTEVLVGSPSSSRAMVRALTCGQEAIAPMLRTFNDSLHLVVARALAGGEPDAQEWDAAQVVQQVWFASAISWAADIVPPAYIEESVVRALELIDKV